MDRSMPIDYSVCIQVYNVILQLMGGAPSTTHWNVSSGGWPLGPTQFTIVVSSSTVLLHCSGPV